jgi:hypothetical protein
MEDSPREARKEQVGQFEFSVAVAEVSAEASARWAARVGRLAEFLLRSWEKEQGERKCE